MLDKIKKLKWLINNADKIENLLNESDKKKSIKKEKNYDLSGVPDYQLDYINDILEAEK
jgi:hypothetical protein